MPATRAQKPKLAKKLDNGRPPRPPNWSRNPEDKGILIGAVKKEKLNDRNFMPGADFEGGIQWWDVISDEFDDSDKTPERCHTHYVTLRTAAMKIDRCLELKGISWDPKTSQMVATPRGLERIPHKDKVAKTYTHTSFPHYEDILQIEAMKPLVGWEDNKSDDEDEKMEDAGEATESDGSEKPLKSVKKKAGKKTGQPAVTTAHKAEKKTDMKVEKNTGEQKEKGPSHKKVQKSIENQEHEELESEVEEEEKKTANENNRESDAAGDQNPKEAKGDPKPSRYVAPDDEFSEGEIVKIATRAFTEYEFSLHSEDSEPAENAVPQKTKNKGRKIVTGSESVHSDSADENPAVREKPTKVTKRRKRAIDSAPPLPTSSRSSKQTKLDGHFTAAASKKKPKEGPSSESSREESSPAEDAALPSIDKEGNAVAKEKGKADREALQVATPVKTSPVPRRTEPTSDMEAETTPQERAQNEVWEDNMLTNAGRAAMARLFRTDEEEAKEYLRIMANIERCRAYLEEALASLGKDVGRCLM